MNNKKIKLRTKLHTKKLLIKEKSYADAEEKSARAEFLCTQQQGYLEGKDSHLITQQDIKDVADEATAQKIFDLHLPQFGPYRIDYTRNGRHLLMGGAKGHVAAFDWMTKMLMCEMNVMETVTDVKWLHQETMFCVAQKQWTYIYDNQGIELHCLKNLDSVQRLGFLPYHFLLVTASSKGYLAYLDVSIGKVVRGQKTKHGCLDVMAINPQNAIVHLGHPTGTVTLWTPNQERPAAEILCCSSGVRDISIDATGCYMATTSYDRTIKIFDLRTYKELNRFRYCKRYCPGVCEFSQKGLLAVTRDNFIEIYKDTTLKGSIEGKPYLTHRSPRLVADLAFSPFEDVLGIGHGAGFSSIVVPGSGEANFDASEANPYISKSQRKNAEVQLLLDKISPAMISLEGTIGQVDLKTAQELQKERNSKKQLKPDKTDFSLRYKKKGKSSGVNLVKRKKSVLESQDRPRVKELMREKTKERVEKKKKEKKILKKGSALDRMKSKEA